MRFKKILFPEIVLNRRGDAVERKLYQDLLACITTDSLGKPINFDPTLGKNLAPEILKDLYSDPNQRRVGVLCKQFVNSHGKTYHLGKDFALAMQKIDKELPMDILPDTWCGYISFPEDTLFDEEGAVQGGFVWIEKRHDVPFVSMNYFMQDRMLNIHVPCTFLFHLVPGKKIESYIEETVNQDRTIQNLDRKDTDKCRKGVWLALINSVIYLHSQGPLIENSRPATETGLSNKELIRRGSVINECTIPVFFVNRHYVKQRTYQTGSVWVDPFFRWQRCGPGLTQVKWTSVTGHERNYK